MSAKETQVVVRMSEQLERKIKAASKKLEMTKAAWLRHVALKELGGE